MAEYLIQSETLDDIVDAINAKTGGSSAMTPAEMATAIESIESAETVYWNSVYGQYPYWENTVFPLTTLSNYCLREASNLKSFTAPEATSLSSSYLFYNAPIKTANFPKLETISSLAARVFGFALSLQTITIGSVGHGFRDFSGSANAFYQMENLVFTINIYCTGDNVDVFLTKIRSNGGRKAICNFYASETTTYNSASYNAGDLMLKSEVA